MSGQRIDAVERSASRVRLSALLGFCVFFLLVNCGVTQWIASQLHHHQALGRRHLLGLYQPFAWYDWQKWYDAAPTTFNIGYIAILVALLVGIAAAIVAVGVILRSAKQHEGVHGTAHWADEQEIRAAGLLPAPGKKGAGVYVGGWTNPKTGALHYLRHDGPEHIAAIAPTRSGKGVALVIPTCLSWPGSMVLNDMKNELFNLTAGWRAGEGGNTVIRFDPAAEGGSVAFNPLEEIRLGTLNEVGDAQNLVNIIVDPEGKGLADHWAKTSHAFLTGLVLHEMHKAVAQGRSACLYDIAFAISDPSRDIDELYKEMLENAADPDNHYDLKGVHPTVAGAARDMINRPDNERGSVLSTAMSYLGLYRDPLVRRNTSRSDFKVMDLMNAEKPVSLYLIVRAEDKDRMKPLMRLVVNQIVRVLLRPEMTFKDGRQLSPHKHRLLLMLDEFPSLGKLEVFAEALAYVAGYGIKAYLIMQDIAQLWSAYGRDETITSNCHIRTAFAPNKIETAEWMAKLSGKKTENKWQITESGKRFGALADNYSRSATEVSRDLLTPDEAMRLRGPQRAGDGTAITSPGDMLIFASGHAPIYGTQSLFFLDSSFVIRSRIAPPNAAIPLRSPPVAVKADPALADALWNRA